VTVELKACLNTLLANPQLRTNGKEQLNDLTRSVLWERWFCGCWQLHHKYKLRDHKVWNDELVLNLHVFRKVIMYTHSCLFAVLFMHLALVTSLSYTRTFPVQWTHCEQTLSMVWSNGSKKLCSSFCSSNSDDQCIKRLNAITALLVWMAFLYFSKRKNLSFFSA